MNRAIKAIVANNYVVQKWLKEPGDVRKKVRANGIDRALVISQLLAVTGLVETLEFLYDGLKQLALPPATSCPDCKARQQIAAELIVGKSRGS